ncbi:hypothetical protein JXA80_02430 [bacterium]|nr:hypothetical protein [candidate division CSSED10-310 bacterium]
MRRMAVCLWMLFIVGWVMVVEADMGPREIKIRDINAVQERVYEYMSLRKSNDLQGIYETFTSEYRRAVTREEFKKLPLEATMSLLAYYITAIRMDGDRATVHLIEWAIPSGIPTPRIEPNLVQTWVKQDGGWFMERVVTTLEVDFSACGTRRASPASEQPSTIPACGSSKAKKPASSQPNACGK